MPLIECLHYCWGALCALYRFRHGQGGGRPLVRFTSPLLFCHAARGQNCLLLVYPGNDVRPPQVYAGDRRINPHTADQCWAVLDQKRAGGGGWGLQFEAHAIVPAAIMWWSQGSSLASQGQVFEPIAADRVVSLLWGALCAIYRFRHMWPTGSAVCSFCHAAVPQPVYDVHPPHVYSGCRAD